MCATLDRQAYAPSSTTYALGGAVAGGAADAHQRHQAAASQSGFVDLSEWKPEVVVVRDEDGSNERVLLQFRKDFFKMVKRLALSGSLSVFNLTRALGPGGPFGTSDASEGKRQAVLKEIGVPEGSNAAAESLLLQAWARGEIQGYKAVSACTRTIL